MAIRHVAEVLEPGQWAGRRAFVVGGGPSLRGFPFDRLKGEKVVAVNRAYEAVPWADVLFTMDSRFLTWYRDKLGAFKGRLVYHQRTAGDLSDPLQKELGDLFLVGRLGERALGETLEDGIGDGASSGFGAVALAWVLGACPIYLLGFDLAPTAEGLQEWWHNGYPQNDASQYDRFRANFEWMADQVPEGSILNASPDSSIRGFPKVLTWPTKACESALPLFITYWTDDYYRHQVTRLRASCTALGVDLEAFEISDRGSWVLNCAAKPEVVLAALDATPDRDIVFVDADAELVASPDLFRTLDADVAAHMRGGTELLSGTVYFRNCDRTRRLVRRWIELGKEQADQWDQRTLHQAVQEAIRSGLLFRSLPAAYTFIFDSMARDHPDVEPVVLHHQASRTIKKLEHAGGGRRGSDEIRRAGGGGAEGEDGPTAPAGRDVQATRSQDRPERVLSVRERSEVQEVLPGQIPGAAAVPGGSMTPRQVQGVEIPAPADAKMDGYATHQPALVFAASLALAQWPELDWAELGCGWYSTPTLAALGGTDRLTVYSADPDWSSRFTRLVRVEEVEDWTDFRLAKPLGLVFLDNEQLVVERVKLLPRLLAVARLVVMHDWRADLDESLLGTAARFVYGRCGRPWTLIASNHVADLDDLARGRLA